MRQSPAAAALRRAGAPSLVLSRGTWSGSGSPSGAGKGSTPPRTRGVENGKVPMGLPRRPRGKAPSRANESRLSVAKADGSGQVIGARDSPPPPPPVVHSRQCRPPVAPPRNHAPSPAAKTLEAACASEDRARLAMSRRWARERSLLGAVGMMTVDELGGREAVRREASAEAGGWSEMRAAAHSASCEVVSATAVLLGAAVLAREAVWCRQVSMIAAEEVRGRAEVVRALAADTPHAVCRWEGEARGAVAAEEGVGRVALREGCALGMPVKQAIRPVYPWGQRVVVGGSVRA
eukprot:Hpha_TRINITY_DN30636_c0_g1::TRINITY_DN30636_c0_g1_i1::g.18385::m.18385